MGACCATKDTRNYIESSALAGNQELGQNVAWSNTAELAMMNKTQRFEHSMPFHTIRIDIFEGNVKRLLSGQEFVTLKQLRYAFKHRPFWQKHLPFVAGEKKKLATNSDSEDLSGTSLTRLITDEMLLYKER